MFPAILYTGTTNETFQQCGVQDFFKLTVLFSRSTTRIKSGPESFEILSFARNL